MATIRRVTIHRLRNVKPGSTFELHPGLNVLLGQNGTGKTTLLQWMADFMSGNLDPWAAEPYHVEVEMEAGAESARARLNVTVKNDVSTPSPGQGGHDTLDGLALATDEPSRSSFLTLQLRVECGDYRAEVHHGPDRLRVRIDPDVFKEMHGLRFHTLGITSLPAYLLLWAYSSLRGDDPGHQVAIALASKHLAPARDDLLVSYHTNLDRFDESLWFFRRIIKDRESRAHVSSSRRKPFRLPQRVPAELSELIARRINKAQSDMQTLTFTSEDVGFLGTVAELFQYSSAHMHLALLEKETSGPWPVWIYGNLRFTFHRHDGSVIGHDALSHGQKRMLSFLYYLALHQRFIIADELANGLHHAWLKACIEAIGDRQALLTSENPLLLDYLTFDSVDEVRQRFIVCRSERENGREQLIWRNPTQEEAISFFRAYQAGIQHVGEILIEQGLW